MRLKKQLSLSTSPVVVEQEPIKEQDLQEGMNDKVRYLISNYLLYLINVICLDCNNENAAAD